MLRTLAAIVMIAAALPGTAIACGSPARPIPPSDAPRPVQAVPTDQPETPRIDGAASLPLAERSPAALTGTPRCGSWQALLLARADVDRRHHPGADAARNIARR